MLFIIKSLHASSYNLLVLRNEQTPASFLFTKKDFDVIRIQPRIVGIEEKFADHHFRHGFKDTYYKTGVWAVVVWLSW